MKKKFLQKIFFPIFFFPLLFLLFVNFAGGIKLTLAQEARELEIKYPPMRGLQPERVDFPITGYVKYIFNFAIAIVGLIALGVLIVSGIQYLTSAGEPETLKSAKSRIKSAFLGILILLFSYLILFTINPQLVIFKMPGLKEIALTPLEIPPPEEKVPKLLDKIKEIADKVKTISEGIEVLAKEIKELTDKCDCGNTQSLCICTGGDALASCQPRRCYAGPTSQPALETGFHPCLDVEKIQNLQQSILAFRYELLYYKNRAFAEGDDLVLELTKLKRESTYYEGMRQIETEAEVKEYYEEKKKGVDKEIELKTQLLEKLNDLVSYITMISKPIYEIATLPDDCLSNVEDSCDANCAGGCHDIREGCQPAKCSGGNPCPTGEIQNRLNEIKEFRAGSDPNIIKTCDEILEIIEKIIKLKTIYI